MTAPAASTANAPFPVFLKDARFLILPFVSRISGAGIMLLYFLVSTARIRSRVAASIPLKENIYIVDGRMSPFVMGIIRPKIYLPEGLSGKEQEYIVLHERLHIRRLDHIVRPVAFAALCVHWFNPLVWAAFVLSGRDMEMSCDEAVVKRLGEGIRADYSASLLALSAQRPAIRGIPVDYPAADSGSGYQKIQEHDACPGYPHIFSI